MAVLLKAEDFIGKTFHYLTPIKDMGSVRYGKRNLNSVLCRCKCGTEKVYSLFVIKAERIKSCGCYRTENLKRIKTKHGLARHPLYFIWFSMISRCEKEYDPHYKQYGARGISVCNEWKNDFMVFYNWAISNGYKKGLENDRKDNNGNYSPLNCRFTTRRGNCRNKRDNRIITYNGMSKIFIEWCEYLDMPRSVLKDRINKLKWPIDKAFNTPYLKRA